MTDNRVYIHELIEISGANRARYMHHMTANWCPVARAERHQLCYGVWGTVGSTGEWPQVVNLWEIEGWNGLAADFRHELSSPSLQDPALAKWWEVAASFRRGGVDRLLVASPGSRGIEDLVRDGVRGEVYAHELVTLPPGSSPGFLGALEAEGRQVLEGAGWSLMGAFRTLMVNDSEAVVIWACPSWQAWAEVEQAWDRRAGDLGRWRARLDGLGATWLRTLMVDAPLSPLRTGRQPRVQDRRPLEEL